MTVDKALAYAQENKPQFLDELIELVRIPSISTLPENESDMRIAAEWVAKKLTAIGMDNVQVMDTAGHPVVYGQQLSAGPDKPTVVIYGHYDVQPVDPLDLWESDPFEPRLEGDDLVARGASDMKGQVMASIFAIEAIQQLGEGLPVNVKWLIEGEEEIGSPNLAAFIAENAELLAADLALNPDGGILGPDAPAIPYALRGMAYFEINMQGPVKDLHSGQYGGPITNPANELARLIAGMHDEDGRITLPGFYDSVLELSDEERGELARLPMKEDYYLKHTGSPALTGGEKDYTPVERASARPTLDVNGMYSGFVGEGSKTVLPAKSMAKISMRLVPNQDPEEVKKQLRQYLEDNAKPGVKWTLKDMVGAPASLTPHDSDEVQALAKGMEAVWGTRPLFYRVGGSVPVVGQLEEILNIPSVLTGFGLPDDNLHSPNEKLTLAPWYKGICALIHFFYNLAE